MSTVSYINECNVPHKTSTVWDMTDCTTFEVCSDSAVQYPLCPDPGDAGGDDQDRCSHADPARDQPGCRAGGEHNELLLVVSGVLSVVLVHPVVLAQRLQACVLVSSHNGRPASQQWMGASRLVGSLSRALSSPLLPHHIPPPPRQSLELELCVSRCLCA